MCNQRHCMKMRKGPYLDPDDGRPYPRIVCDICAVNIIDSTSNKDRYYHCSICSYNICMKCTKSFENEEEALKRLEHLGNGVLEKAFRDHQQNPQKCKEYFQGEMKSLLAAFASIHMTDGQEKVEELEMNLLVKLLNSVTSFIVKNT